MVWCARVDDRSTEPQLRRFGPMGSRGTTRATYNRRMVTDERQHAFALLFDNTCYRPAHSRLPSHRGYLCDTIRVKCQTIFSRFPDPERRSETDRRFPAQPATRIDIRRSTRALRSKITRTRSLILASCDASYDGIMQPLLRLQRAYVSHVGYIHSRPLWILSFLSLLPTATPPPL